MPIDRTDDYYPYLSDFWTMYTVRFPVAVAGRPLVASTTRALVFRMSSTQGQVEMEFPVQAPTAAPAPSPSPAAPATPPSSPAPR
jgi:hypothetical protein